MITAHVSWYNSITQHQLHHFPGNPIGNCQKVRSSKSWTPMVMACFSCMRRVFFFFSERFPWGKWIFHEFSWTTNKYDSMIIKHCKYWWFSWNMIINTVNTDAENALAGFEPWAKHIFLCFWPIDKRMFLFLFPVDDWMDVVKVCSFLIVN